jgi:hypothetical protein
MNRIIDEKLDTKFGFFHINKNRVKDAIGEILENLI